MTTTNHDNTPIDVILFGPPGAGKGTQARKLEAVHGLTQVSTGNMLRARVNKGDEIGQQVEQIMADGKLVPDDLILRLVQDRLSEPDCKNGFILDGFPRTVAQAEGLNKILGGMGRELNAVIEIQVPQELVIERITGRFTCAECGATYHDTLNPPEVEGVCDECGSTEFNRRADDNVKSVKQRLAAYKEKTAPVLPYYDGKNALFRVEGDRPVEQVFEQIETILQS